MSLITWAKPQSHCIDYPLQGQATSRKFFSFAVMMLNINHEPAQQNTACFPLTTPMAFTGSSWGVEIKGTVLQALLEPASASKCIVPTANESLIAPNCFASQRCDPPAPLPSPLSCSHHHPPICLSLLPANKPCRREMCCYFSSVSSSLKPSLSVL